MDVEVYSAARHQLVLRSALDLPHFSEFDTTLRFVDDLPTLAYSSYTALDLGLSRHPREGYELALVGQNLLDAHHPEQTFAFSASAIPSEVERGVYGGVVWGF